MRRRDGRIDSHGVPYRPSAQEGYRQVDMRQLRLVGDALAVIDALPAMRQYEHHHGPRGRSVTQTYRKVPGQRSSTRRPGIVYVYDTLRTDEYGTPTTGIEVGYVGKTVQRLSARDDQHRGLAAGPDGTPPKCQPFSDLIVGGIRIVEQGVWTDEELSEREVFHIRRLAPRFNYSDNLANPGRVPIPIARQRRDRRDQVRGVEPQSWTPCRPTVKRSRMSPKWRRRRNVALAWMSGWLGAFGTAWLLLALLLAPHLHLSWQEWPILAAGLCAEPLVFLARRGGKRKTRTLRWALAGLIAVATAVLMAVVA